LPRECNASPARIPVAFGTASQNSFRKKIANEAGAYNGEMRVGFAAEPLVSVYWISGYRGPTVISLVEDFLNRTSWSNLELIVVDWSVGPDGIATRDQIKASSCFHKVHFTDSCACEFGNRNQAIRLCSGDFLLGLEDDVRLRRNISTEWLHDAIKIMQESDIDDLCLWNPNASFPSTLAALSTRASAMRQTPRPAYPTEFRSISESQRFGNGAFHRQYKNMGLKCRGISVMETSMLIPSKNFVHQKNFTLISYKALDQLIESDAKQIRSSTIGWVEYEAYQKLRKSGALKMRVVSTSRLVRLNLRLRKLLLLSIRRIRHVF
jgi:hypothetical protein